MDITQSDKNKDVKQIARRWRGVPGMVTGALQDVQRVFGYLPRAEMETLSRELEVPSSQLFGVATFFSFFRLDPLGKHHVQVCEGTACHVLGAPNLSMKICRDLAIGENGITADKRFSMERVHCLGCCGMGPVVRIDGETFGRVRQKDIAKLFKPYGNEGEGGEDK